MVLPYNYILGPPLKTETEIFLLIFLFLLCWQTVTNRVNCKSRFNLYMLSKLSLNSICLIHIYLTDNYTLILKCFRDLRTYHFNKKAYEGMPGPSNMWYLLQGRPQKNFHMEACFKCGKASRTAKTALHFKAVARPCPDLTIGHWGIDCPTFPRQVMSLFPNYYLTGKSVTSPGLGS